MVIAIILAYVFILYMLNKKIWKYIVDVVLDIDPDEFANDLLKYNLHIKYFEVGAKLASMDLPKNAFAKTLALVQYIFYKKIERMKK